MEGGRGGWIEDGWIVGLQSGSPPSCQTGEAIHPPELNVPQGMGAGSEPYWHFCIALSRCFESLSQKLKVPSPPAVTKVQNWGWKEMELTA